MLEVTWVSPDHVHGHSHTSCSHKYQFEVTFFLQNISITLFGIYSSLHLTIGALTDSIDHIYILAGMRSI